ncbi:MAG: hypothetical protein NTX98_01630, partial [Candidatus Doudnabacteria bacterium]|nr:hypothetical protein [Candidatus Doudnabacteria bacterium]
ETTEKSQFLPGHKHLSGLANKAEAVAESVFDLALHTGAKVIIGATDSGFTAREVAHERPYFSRLLMLTPKPKVLRQMNLIWGVEGFLTSEAESFEELIDNMMEIIKNKKLAKKGDKVVVVTGEPLGQKENLNLVEVKTV